MFLKKWVAFFLFLILLFSFSRLSASPDTLSFFDKSPTLNKKRLNTIKYSAVVLYPTSIAWLYTQWYENYPRTTFHFFNDDTEWEMMDKYSHVWAVNLIGKGLMHSFQWAGLEDKKAMWYGVGLSYLYLTTIEVLDGFSSEWGFSWGDVTANTIGAGVLVSQQYLWNEQRIVLKGSFHQTTYSQYRPKLLGLNLPENMVKDYNGLTWWASINPHSFLGKQSKFPKWLSLAVGFGAEGMTGGKENVTTVDGATIPPFSRYKQYYLGIDFDLARIETRSKSLNRLFKIINIIRLPAPAIEFNNGHKTKFYAFYF